MILLRVLEISNFFGLAEIFVAPDVVVVNLTEGNFDLTVGGAGVRIMSATSLSLKTSVLGELVTLKGDLVVFLFSQFGLFVTPFLLLPP